MKWNTLLVNACRTGVKRCSEWWSVRVKLPLVLALVLDQVGVVFTIVWILLLVDRMYPAPILPIAMGMIHLCLARLQETSTEFGDSIRGTHVHIEGVQLIRYTERAFRILQVVTFDFVRGSYLSLIHI